jgi:deoxyribonuclease-4
LIRESKMRFGVHVSIAGGLGRAVQRAKERDCETLQIFVGNPRSWQGRDYFESEIAEFREGCRRERLAPVVGHAPYIMNLACRDEALWKRSVEGLARALRRSQMLGCDYLVTHLGSHGGAGNDEGMRKISLAVNTAMEGFSGVTLLLENSAGAGFSLGHSLEQLSRIISDLSSVHRVGVCVDTCHAFAAGYDLASPKGLSQMLVLFDELIGLTRWTLIHANDSKAPLGSRLDRHEELGKGYLGQEGFRLIVNHPELRELPCILETPRMGLEDDLRNLAFIRKLVCARNV